jgi:GGDEF domain-containing protein
MNHLIRKTAAAAALIALATGPLAHAQTVSPSGGVSAYDIGQSGLSVAVDPQRSASVDLDAGPNGGASVGAGPQGAQVNVRPGAVSLPATPATPGTTPTESSQGGSGNSGGGTGSQPAPAGGDSTAAAPASPAAPPGAAGPGPSQQSSPGNSTNAAVGETADSGDSAGSADRRVGTQPVAERGPRGVAPVLDFIEKVPSAVWAALTALGLIALALWLMWVRGRRQLERNAWVDSESGDMNLVAFETFLAQEWVRAVRYQRPLGLLLLELEESRSDGSRRPLTGKRLSDARAAITERVREADTVAQLSPSRFAVICPESPVGSVQTVARALESSLEAAQVHARVGISGRSEDDRGPADLVSRAALELDEPATWGMPALASALTAGPQGIHAHA